ncbi:hypothetical protein [Halorussus pelagicus]|nr:hypothetical protein [Halorussus pelagicus]
MTDSETPPPTIDRASTLRSSADRTRKSDERAPRSRLSATPEEH